MAIIWILIGLAAVFGYIYIRKHFKIPKIGAMVGVRGGVKSGKTTFSFYVAKSTYKRNLREVKFVNFFRKLFNKPLLELPKFYSTIPVGFPHVILTKELLQRKERFAYKSVIFVDEASLFADSMLVKDTDLNDELLLFNKLIAHETHGGTIVYNSQSISDLHYSVRRCLSECFYVHSTFKWLPFFMIVTVREERYSEDGTVVNSYTDDVEETLKRVIVPKSVWKDFDCYCYSVMTDDLEVADKEVEAETLKSEKIISFNPRHCFEKNKLVAECSEEKKVDYRALRKAMLENMNKEKENEKENS